MPPDAASRPEDRSAIARALRDLEAAQSRVERDAERVHEDTRLHLVSELLPVLDNLARTLRAAGHPPHRADPAIVEGVRLEHAQLERVLHGYGVDRIDAAGERFDPAVHDAISVTRVGDPARHNVVLEQIEPGYRFGGRLLRPVKVVVGRASV